jgi:hypothetical protein
MTIPNTSYIAQVIVNAYEDNIDKYSSLAEVVRVIADELSYTVFEPGNDFRVIDASIVYEVASELENL